MWATPAEVRTYSAYPEVDAKTDPELNILLEKAESFIKVYTCRDFADATADELAMLKTIDCALVEMFVLGQGNAALLANVLKSERIGEYSYTKETKAALWESDTPTGDPYVDQMLRSLNRCSRRARPLLTLMGPTRYAESKEDEDLVIP